ncbi:hypothetical protein [Actinoplanes subglobosus]|uniref:Uncharacterized protein n=1 Tax=Actinoplanes subglobosus TaxID=1547892 RepID=A0ABV8J265_9ACTN
MNSSEMRALARNVVVRVANHDPGWRLAYPVRRLIRAGDRGYQIAADAVWECWMLDPGERWWTALRRWGRPADRCSKLSSGFFGPEEMHRLSFVALDRPEISWSAEGLVQALGRRDHPIAEIARQRLLDPGEHVRIDDVCLAATGSPDAVGFLTSAGILPAGLPARAAYLLLTKQQERFWELDPDQALLTRAYRELPALRPALREEMPWFGDLDPARILRTALAGARKTPAEIAYVTRQMVAGHDWAGLWWFARDLSPIEAVVALRDADPEWQPAGRDGAELYSLLRSTDEHHLRERIEVLAAPRRLVVSGPVLHGAFSADERTIAVTVRSKLLVYDVESADLTTVHDLDDIEPGPVSFEDDRPIVCQLWRHQSPARSTLWRFESGRRTGRALVGWGHALLPGTVDGTTQVALTRRTPGSPSPELMLVRRHGPRATRPPRLAVAPAGSRLCTDPVSRRLAFAGDRLVVAELGRGNQLRCLAVSPHVGERVWQGLCLAGPDRLFSVDRDELVRWEIVDGRLEATGRLPCFYDGIAWVPYRNAVAVHDFTRGVRYLDADTLEPQDQPGELRDSTDVRVLWSAPGGSGSHASGGYREIQVIPASSAALSHLARQPMTDARLATVPHDAAARDRAGPLADLLAANDRYRTSVRSAG